MFLSCMSFLCSLRVNKTCVRIKPRKCTVEIKSKMCDIDLIWKGIFTGTLSQREIPHS